MNIITTICGNETAAFKGDGGLALKAELNKPEGFCLDKDGNIYIADAFNNKIRKITASTGIITSIAGVDTGGYSGDGGPATNAALFIPETVFADSENNIYIADAGNNRIRKITVSTGIITTVAGSDSTVIIDGVASGDGGLATNAILSVPTGLCLDKSGNIYIAAYGNNQVRKVDALTGIITTIAGKATKGYIGGFIGYSGDGNAATNATFSGAGAVFVDDVGDVYICDQWNNAIRKVNVSTGIISTIAGGAIAGYSGDGGVARNAKISQPAGIYVDKNGNIFIAEYGNGIIRKIDGTTTIISTVAGNGTLGFSGDGGPATNAKLRCSDVFLDNFGHIFIADLDNNRIREVFDSATVGIGNVQVADHESARVYPNPATNTITIENAENSEVSMFNVLGQEVFKAHDISNKEVINVDFLISGVYMVQITFSNGSKQSWRVVKE